MSKVNRMKDIADLRPRRCGVRVWGLCLVVGLTFTVRLGCGEGVEPLSSANTRREGVVKRPGDSPRVPEDVWMTDWCLLTWRS
jgi:hypothetical protein